MKYFIGIDPGVSGGICMLDEAGRLLFLVNCEKTMKGQWDTVQMLVDHCGKYLNPTTRKAFVEATCCVEHVHSMPKQGVRSTWTFSGNYHAWLMALVAAGIPYQQVSPQRWQKHFGAMPKEKALRKTRLLHLAEQRFPSTKITKKLADAVLLAVYQKETS